MIETGILNRAIAAEISRMGHTDKMIIADAGLALPNSVVVVDISLKKNAPTVMEMLDEVLKHFSVEKVILAQATADVSPTRYRDIRSAFDDTVEVEIVDHAFLRDELTKQVKFAIRTGDFTAYSNVVLVSAGGPRWYCETPE